MEKSELKELIKICEEELKYDQTPCIDDVEELLEVTKLYFDAMPDDRRCIHSGCVFQECFICKNSFICKERIKD